MVSNIRLKQKKNQSTTKTTSNVLVMLIVQLGLKIPTMQEHVD